MTKRTRKCPIEKAIFWPVRDVPLLVCNLEEGQGQRLICQWSYCAYLHQQVQSGGLKTHFAFPLKMSSVIFLKLLFPFFKCFSTSLSLLMHQSRKDSLTVQTEWKLWVTFTHQASDGNGFPLWEYDFGLQTTTCKCAWVSHKILTTGELHLLLEAVIPSPFLLLL